MWNLAKFSPAGTDSS